MYVCEGEGEKVVIRGPLEFIWRYCSGLDLRRVYATPCPERAGRLVASHCGVQKKSGRDLWMKAARGRVKYGRRVRRKDRGCMGGSRQGQSVGLV